MPFFRFVGLCFALVTLPLAAVGQQPIRQSAVTRPVEGLRQADTSPVLLSGAEVVVAPDRLPLKLDILVDGAMIVRVEPKVDPPAGTRRLDMSGKRIYAGLIDAMHEVELPSVVPQDAAAHWNANVTPQYRAAWSAGQADANIDKLRRQGITTQLLAPRGGIVKGSSCVVLLLDPDRADRMLRSDVFQHVRLTVPEGKSRDRYPNSPMGATALLRQSMYDAVWYRDANRAYQNQSLLPRPEPNSALEKLAGEMESTVFVFDAANERMAIRSLDVADEFSLRTILRGSGREYRGLAEIARPESTILLPIDFPSAPDAATRESIRRTPLVDWLHWHLAPENPARLHAAGVRFCLTTDGLDDPGVFLKQVRQAVSRGLDRAVAHAALTTVPAEILGIDETSGRIEAGMLANLVITDDDLFADKTKVLETWVAGQRFEIDDQTRESKDPLVGEWTLKLPTSGLPRSVSLQLQPSNATLTGKLRSKAQVDEKDVRAVDLQSVIRDRDRMSATVELRSLADDLPSGASRLTLLTIDAPENAEAKINVMATLTTPDGQAQSVDILRDDTAEIKEPESSTTAEATVVTKSVESNSIELMFPLGAYGLTQPPVQSDEVLFRGGTVWTCGPDDTLERCDVLVRKGKIAEVGYNLAASNSCIVVDVAGKHLTPGLIDCHSHIATDGGINESGQAITSDVRIADFIDNSDISIYRQLAGGVTTANILHGSANPIGGQSLTIKLRWGESMEGMTFADAPAGIKFALGENVKRMGSRYPNTRMGVEQILRDQFLAARQYGADRDAWQSGRRNTLPPRRNLQLDAITEIQQGKRWVHCHSYRQDEIVATLDVLEEFNVQIGTLQHILEGYKVADRIAAHGAMASSFADWWAYKFEVFDAIPYNGVLMHEAGIVVSFNSDDPELARHLNTEAAKATKYGGVPEIEAIKFVTLNPAKQLRIDDRVGSIEVGKDADLVVWSGRPLSTMTRCEQTWIDGRRYFSIDSDRDLRLRDQQLAARLIQLAMASKDDRKEKSKDKKEEEEDRWVRFDEFCGAGGNREVAKP